MIKEDIKSQIARWKKTLKVTHLRFIWSTMDHVYSMYNTVS